MLICLLCSKFGQSKKKEFSDWREEHVNPRTSSKIFIFNKKLFSRLINRSKHPSNRPWFQLFLTFWNLFYFQKLKVKILLRWLWIRTCKLKDHDCNVIPWCFVSMTSTNSDPDMCCSVCVKPGNSTRLWHHWKLLPKVVVLSLSISSHFLYVTLCYDRNFMVRTHFLVIQN